MAPSVSKLLTPPPSHTAASTWRHRLLLLPRSTASSSPSLRRPAAGRRIAPPPPPRYLPSTSSTPCRCAPASDLAAGATATMTGLDSRSEEEEEESELDDDIPPFDGEDEDGRRRLEGGNESAAAYPAAMNALYAACLAGNVTEHLWSFTWPATVATLHHRSGLLPVAVLGFFSKLVVFAAGPLVGHLVSALPRIPAYRSLTVIQTAAHIVSAAMLTHAFTTASSASASASARLLLLQPWFAALAASTAVDRLAAVCLGVITERDLVVQLAGGEAGRPVALARANALLSRVELVCETAGASVSAALLSRNDAATCVRLSCAASLAALPLLLFLAGAINRLAGGVFDADVVEHYPPPPPESATPTTPTPAVAWWWETVRRGWTEYLRQPVLPASLAYVLLCFNVALAPGALMTTFLIHHGVSAPVLGAFGGSSAAVGILATFLTPYLVKELGILKAGAAGLVTQSALLAAAVVVFLLSGGSPSGGALFAFLGLIVASRLGHMAYSVIGLQLVQTGNPRGKAKLIGATEVAVASLAELAMMAVAAVAGDAKHFGCLAALSAASVAAAACLFCAWLANPSDELRRLFPC